MDLKLDKAKWLKIGKGALIAGAGTILTVVVSQGIPELAQSGATGAIVASVLSVLANYALKAIQSAKE